METHERALVFTVSGRDTVRIEEIDRESVYVINQTEKIAPILFVVGRSEQPAWITTIQKLLGGI